MKLTGPLICLVFGILIFGVGWVSGTGPTDHNIGRGIASGIMQQGLAIIGGLICFVGIIWLLIRWFGQPPK